MITEQDKELVNELATKHLGHHAYKTGVFPTDEEINESLLTSDAVIIPEIFAGTSSKGFTLRGVASTFEQMNLKPSFAYLKCFYSALMAHRKDEVKVSEIAEFLKQRFADKRKGF